jgi:hypothetical protein
MVGEPVQFYTRNHDIVKKVGFLAGGFLGREAILGGSKEPRPLLERGVKSGHFHTVFCALAENPNRSLSLYTLCTHCQKSISILPCFRTGLDKEIQDRGLVLFFQIDIITCTVKKS